MTPILQVRLLGGYSLHYDGQTVPGLGSERVQSLLAYLLLNRAVRQSRQQIAFLFWPETSDAQAQTNLRQLLHTVRRRLPNADRFLDASATTVGWRADAPFTLDVADFTALLGRAGHASGPEEIALLERVVGLYGGELLPGCYDDWLLRERELLAQQFGAALERLTLRHEERRNYPAAIASAQQLLRHDPLHEATYRRLMRLHALNGDRTAALRVYHACATLLERELGVEPGASTRAAYERLLRAEGTAPAAVPPRVGEVGLVGRRNEWQALQTAWRTVQRSGPHLVCLRGEAGIGKTRLADEMSHWAQSQGIGVLRAQAYAAEGALAYAPLVECLRNETLQAGLSQLDPVWLAELARLRPELLVLHPQVARPEPISERWQRQRLFEALARALMPASRPLVFVIDDFQWCDAETLEWLHYLLRFDPRAPLLVIATLRPEEVTVEHAAERLLLDLHRSVRVSELTLGPLDDSETAELANRVAERNLDTAALARVIELTEGNPLFVVETVRARFDESVGDPRRGAEAAADIPALPPKVHAVIQSRLARLSPPARDLASVGATIGRSFALDVLAAACDLDEDTVVRSLDELWLQHIVREHGVNGYDFTHDRLREVAYGELSPARRRQLHRRVAQALEQTAGEALDGVSAQVAAHYEAAGQLPYAIDYLQRAADVALRLYAYGDAIAMVEHGLALVPALPAGAGAHERELELQMKLCSAWATTTSYLGREAEVAYRRALELCRQVRQTPHLFTVLWGLHEVALYRGEYRESIELAQQCVRIAEELDDPGILLEAYHAVWGPYYFLGEYAQALGYMERGLALYERARHEPLSVHYGVHDAAACALYESALALWNVGYLNQAQRRLAEAVAHAEQLTMPANIADAFAYAGLIYHLLRDPVQVQRFAEPALRISVERGYPYSRFLGAVELGWSLALQGQAAEGIALVRQGMAAVEEFGQILHYSQLTAMAAETCLAAGRPAEAIEVLDEGIARFEKYRDLLCAADLWTLRGDALGSLTAAHDEVEECYRNGLALARQLGARVSALRAATALAQLQRGHGQEAEARQALQETLDWFTEGYDSPDLHAARMVLASLPNATSNR